MWNFSIFIKQSSVKLMKLLPPTYFCRFAYKHIHCLGLEQTQHSDLPSQSDLTGQANIKNHIFSTWLQWFTFTQSVCGNADGECDGKKSGIYSYSSVNCNESNPKCCSDIMWFRVYEYNIFIWINGLICNNHNKFIVCTVISSSSSFSFRLFCFHFWCCSLHTHLFAVYIWF